MTQGAETEHELYDLAASRIGRTLCGKWTLESILGVGGMATVYAARHRNGKRVAIKMLHPHLSMSKSLRKRFLREGYVANAVGHPGAVGADDDDVDEDGAAFLVMELLDGLSLEEHAEACGGALPPTEVLRYGVALLDVLATAHENGIVHRDIKPANLYITVDDELKVLDFGIARVRELPAFSKASMTQTGAVIGTPAFMAPEQAGGRVDEVGPWTDVWAVGATLFALLTGRLVHEASTMPELMAKAIRDPAPSLGELMPRAPQALVEAIDRSLAFDYRERWRSAEAMRDALDAIAPEELAPLAAVQRIALAKTTASEPPASSRHPSTAQLSSTEGTAVTTSEPAPSWTPRLVAGAMALAGLALAITRPWVPSEEPDAHAPAVDGSAIETELPSSASSVPEAAETAAPSAPAPRMSSSPSAEPSSPQPLTRPPPRPAPEPPSPPPPVSAKDGSDDRELMKKRH